MMRQIHIPSDVNPHPYSHELFAARAVSNYFDTDVTFIKRSDTAKTADLKIRIVVLK